MVTSRWSSVKVTVPIFDSKVWIHPTSLSYAWAWSTLQCFRNIAILFLSLRHHRVAFIKSWTSVKYILIHSPVYTSLERFLYRAALESRNWVLQDAVQATRFTSLPEFRRAKRKLCLGPFLFSLGDVSRCLEAAQSRMSVKTTTLFYWRQPRFGQITLSRRWKRIAHAASPDGR